MDKIIRAPELVELVGLSLMHISRLEAAGSFPKRFKLAPGGVAVGWLSSEIQEFIADRAAAREIGYPKLRAAGDGARAI